MRRTVIICLNPFISHFIPTLLFAKQIQKLKHRVVYLGFQNLQSAVEAEGFEYCTIKSCDNSKLSLLQKQHDFISLAALYRELHQEIQGFYQYYQADLIMIGISRFLIYLPPVFAMESKVAFYSLCAGEPAFNSRCPPVTSDYVPSIQKISGLLCVMKWLHRFIRKVLAPYNLLSFFYYPWPMLMRKCRANRIRWKFGIDGYYPDFPVVVFGSKHFEFYTDNTVMFTGLCIEKKEDVYAQNPILKFEDNEKPLIYCCLGTMSRRYMNANCFIEAVIDLFKKNPQWNLILSLGTRGEKIDVAEPARNIRIVDFVQQLSILKYADIMLTHGGHSTIKECIFSGVPMLVFPCSYDQHGNAARVQYHQIGIKSKLLKKTWKQRKFKNGNKSITSDDIKPLIEEILCQKSYSENICSLREKITNNEELNTVIQFLF